MSRKPCVVSSAHFAPLRSRMVLIATVVPWRNSPAAENCEPALPTPLSMPVTSRCGVVSVLPRRSAPVASSNAATSVNVPPTSADRRMAESRNGAFTVCHSELCRLFCRRIGHRYPLPLWERVTEFAEPLNSSSVIFEHDFINLRMSGLVRGEHHARVVRRKARMRMGVLRGFDRHRAVVVGKRPAPVLALGRRL